MVTFAIRNKPVLLKNVNANLTGSLYGATLHNFFLARFARSVFKTFIKCFVQSGTSTKHTSHSTPRLTS